MVVQIDARRRFFGRTEKYFSNTAKLKIVDQDKVVSQRIKFISRIIASSIGPYNIALFDFRVMGGSEVWFLECNYIPGMGKVIFYQQCLKVMA
ncbi:hypothetical protein [Mesorhizobium sp. M0482]|uniref:hypothetical protein n=1 Tax=Mesorhizobium sp. M0482 TaxID=2956948 RepID=UPI0033383136